ncbi:MAG: glutaredoxin [Saprospiraceae bacterium]|nr:glutaredoxin [Saprospiraceae bacterium]
MKTHNREILLYYHPENRSDRQTLAMAKGMSKHVRSYAYGKTPSTETSWKGIIQSLDCHPKDLLDKSHPYYQHHIKGREFDDESWVKILRFNPDIIRVPIAMSGRKAILCKTPSDIHRLFEKR